MYDAYMILMTAFAVFGRYSFLDMIFNILSGVKSPPSVTVMRYSRSDRRRKKIKYIHNTLFNNRVILIGGGDENVYPDTIKVSRRQLERRTEENLLFVQKK